MEIADTNFKILLGQKLYINWLQELLSTFVFPDKLMKGGDIMDFQKGGISEKGGMTPLSNYKVTISQICC